MVDVQINVLFGSIAIRPTPLICAGQLFGWPHEITKYDLDGKVTERYYTAPAAWMFYS